MDDVFGGIYRANLWHGVESLSGPGSGTAATRELVQALPALVERLGVASVLDVGCGDGWWMPDLPGYMGIDVADDPIRLARDMHPGRLYGVVDLRDAPPPRFHLIIVRDVFQHLSWASGMALLRNIRRSGSDWLLASTYAGTVNHDIPDGDYCEPDLTAPPYGLPEPTERLFDGYAYDGSGQRRDPRKFLGLWEPGSWSRPTNPAPGAG